MSEEDQQLRVEYLDGEEGADAEVTNWISRPGKARVTYPNGSTFEGFFDGERNKTGQGLYVWRETDEEGEVKEIAK